MPQLIGKRVANRYFVETLLGEGGMGRVYAALDERRSEDVALKVIRPERLQEPALRRRFACEVRAAAALDHPAIVRVLDAGQDVGRGSFFTMERVAGPSLAAYAPGRLSWRKVRRLFLDLLGALAHAHARGVVHLDLKPSNLLLAPRASQSTLKLTDFGIARLRAEPREQGRQEEGMAIAGTPGYMAPEQVLGLHSAIGPASDLFAVGVLLYEQVTGVHPFPGATPEAQLRAQLEGRVGAPVFSRREDVPQGVEPLLARLLHGDPRERLDCAARARAHLRRLPSGKRMPCATHAPTPEAATGDGVRARIATGTRGFPLDTLDPLPGALDTTPLRMDTGDLGGALPNLVTLREAPLSGREREREELLLLAEGVEQGWYSGLALLRGAEGSGRSRLARAIGESLTEEGRFRSVVVSCTCNPEREFEAQLTRALEAAACLVPRGLQARDPQPSWCVDDASHERWRPLLKLVAGKAAGAPWDTDECGALRFVRALRCWSGARPVYLLVDDIMALPGAGRALQKLSALREAAQHVDLALLLVVTLPETLPEDCVGMAELRAAADVQIMLGPVDRGAAATIPASLLPMTRETAREIVDLVGTLPRDLVEYVRWATEVGQLTMHAGNFWLQSGALPGGASPTGARTLLSSRLEALARSHVMDRRALRVLEMLALLGRSVAPERLTSALGALMPDYLRDGEEMVLRWIEKGLLCERDGALSFTDRLTHEVVLRRARSHPEARRWMQWDALDRARHEPEDSLEQAFIAGRLLEAHDAAGLSWALRALPGLLDRGHVDLAAGLLERIEERDPRARGSSVILWYSGRIALEKGNWDVASSCATALERERGDELAASRSAYLRARLAMASDPDAALQALEHAIASWPSGRRSGPELNELLALHVELVHQLRKCGAYERAAEGVLRALPLCNAAAAPPARLAALRCSLAFIHLETGRYDAARAEAHRVLQDHDLHLRPADRLEALKVLAGATLRSGASEEAVALAEEALAVALREGHPRHRATILNLLSMCRYEQGRTREALALAREASEALARAPDPVLEGRVLNNMASAARALGRQRAAEELWLQAIRLSASVQDAQNEARARVNLAELLMEMGAPEEGLRVLTPAMDHLRRMRLPYLAYCESLASRLRETLYSGGQG